MYEITKIIMNNGMIITAAISDQWSRTCIIFPSQECHEDPVIKMNYILIFHW